MLKKNLIVNSDDLPSYTKLRRSTTSAIFIVIAIFVLFVLPAEYGIDITGVGRISGLTKMGEIKVSLAKELASEKTTTLASAQNDVKNVKKEFGLSNNDVRIVLNTGEAAEIKLEMKKGQSVDFVWKTLGGKLNVDSHGDPYEKPEGFYHGYGKKQMITEDKGVLVASFDGLHGWYWRNRSNTQVTLLLEVKGKYQNFKRIV